MAESGEGFREVPKEVRDKDQNDVVSARKSKPYSRRTKARVKLGAALMAGASMIHLNAPQAPHAQGNERPPGIESVVAINRGLPPFPEFKRPDKDQRVLVVPMLEKNEQVPLTTAQLEEALESVRINVENVSDKKLNFKFMVLPWQVVDLPKDRDQSGRIDDIGDELLAKAKVKDLEQYQKRLYVLPPDQYAAYGGVAFGSGLLGRDRDRAIAHARVGENGSNFASIAKHELGHMLGMPHANSVDSSEKKTEYGGLDDPMGATREIAIGYNAPQRVSMGWIERDQVQSIEQDGIYALDALDFARQDKAELTKVLRIKKPDTGEIYYISFRPQGGILGGINIHRWNEKLKSSPNEVLVPEKMRKGWQDGDEFRDEKNGITIRQISTHGPVSYVPPEEVQLQITFDKK